MTFAKGVPIWGLIALLPFLWGCSAIPPEARKEADLSISFPELQKDPDSYLGQTVLLAGMIMTTTEVKGLEGQKELEVLQKPLKRKGEPIAILPSEGRFIISHFGFLDPAVYLPGRYVTVLGQVTGSRMLKIGETEYRVPIIRSKSLYAWSQFLQDYHSASYDPRTYPGYPYAPRYGDFYYDWFLYYPFPF